MGSDEQERTWSAIYLVHGPEALKRVQRLGMGSRQRIAATMDEAGRDWKKILAPIVSVIGALGAAGYLQTLWHAAEAIIMTALGGSLH